MGRAVLLRIVNRLPRSCTCIVAEGEGTHAWAAVPADHVHVPATMQVVEFRQWADSAVLLHRYVNKWTAMRGRETSGASEQGTTRSTYGHRGRQSTPVRRRSSLALPCGRSGAHSPNGATDHRRIASQTKPTQILPEPPPPPPLCHFPTLHLRRIGSTPHTFQYFRGRPWVRCCEGVTVRGGVRPNISQNRKKN